MEKLDWSKCPVIEADPARHHGDWVFKDSRLPVALIFRCLADNATIDDVIDWYGADPGQVKELLKFMAARLEQTPAFDHDVPHPLRTLLRPHTVVTTAAPNA